MCRAEKCTYPSGGAAFFARFDKSQEHEERSDGYETGSNGYEKGSSNLVLPE